MTLPKFSWLMRPFWQNTQPKLQPEKKMQPAPFFPAEDGLFPEVQHRARDD